MCTINFPTEEVFWHDLNAAAAGAVACPVFADDHFLVEFLALVAKLGAEHAVNEDVDGRVENQKDGADAHGVVRPNRPNVHPKPETHKII